MKTHATLCPTCTPKTAFLTHQSVLQDTTEPHLVYLGPPEGKIRRMVHALKYHGNARVADSLAEALASKVPASWQLDCLCPVPLHPKRLQQRGYNQSRVLAEAVGKKLGLPTLDLLKRTVYTAQQAKLHHLERQSNLEGVFDLQVPAQGKSILLVDDVLSTGATLRASAQILQRGGARAVYFLVVAR